MLVKVVTMRCAISEAVTDLMGGKRCQMSSAILSMSPVSSARRLRILAPLDGAVLILSDQCRLAVGCHHFAALHSGFQWRAQEREREQNFDSNDSHYADLRIVFASCSKNSGGDSLAFSPTQALTCLVVVLLYFLELLKFPA